jgi:Fe-S cluster assembly ATP-binding protein
MLQIKNLHVSVDGKSVLKGVDLTIKSGEIHALMGPNGGGKSTLSNVIMGHPKYKVTKGEILFNGKNILELETHERALLGIFMAFQYPKEIDGVTLEEFLLAAYRARQKYLDPAKPPILVFRFKKMLDELMAKLKMENGFAKRYLNKGFSGGEKKKSEILQMSVLKPDLAILDETDSGLDVDALKIVSEGVNSLRDGKMGALIITHYSRILKYITPDFVHVLKDGKIVKSGGKEFATEISNTGFENI